MLYVQNFQQNRQNNLREYQRLRSTTDQNFYVSSNQYKEKLTQLSRPTTHASTPTVAQERTSALVISTRIQPLLSLNNNNNDDLSILNTKATSWKPQNSRITRDNKDYMTALARGLTRDDRQQITHETNDIFSSRWHSRPATSIQRPTTGKSGTTGSRSRPPTSTTERGKMPSGSSSENYRPTTAPVITERQLRRINTGKVRPVVATRPSPPPPPPSLIPFRVSRVAESSGNSDHITNSTSHSLTGGLKPLILKGDNHFVHQLCLDTNDSVNDQLSNSCRDSLPDIANSSSPRESTRTKQQLIEITDGDQDKHQTNTPDPINEPVNTVDDLPSLETPHDELEEIDQRTIEQDDDEDILQRDKDMDEYSFDFPFDTSENVYDYASPFSDEYEQVIAAQSQFPTTSGISESNLRDLYRDNKIRPESNVNIKGVFEKCIKLARLQANTVKWEQRRRQNLMTYNRLMKTTTIDASTTNSSGNFSAKNNTNNTNANDKDIRELNEIKRDLKCNECKRITCLGNCAPGQNYHLYKRIVSSYSSQTFSSRQLSTLNGSNNRCKHGYTTCPISSCRTTTDPLNSNTTVTSVNNNNRVRSSRTTFSYAEKSQRSTTDLRPRSVRHVSGEMRVKYEQQNLSPVVVVPLFQDESRNSQHRSTNGLLPGKSFRSQRKDSLTMLSSQKMTS